MFALLNTGLAVIGLGLLLAISLPAWMRRQSSDRILHQLSEIPEDTVIVFLGCPLLNRQGEPNGYFLARAATTAAAYHAVARRSEVTGQPPPKIICSGWNAKGEVTEMLNALSRARVPTENISLDRDAARTIDSIDSLARTHPTGQFLFVSQAFHLPRVLFLARRHGQIAWGLPAAGEQTRLRARAREVAACIRSIADTIFLRRRS